MIRVLANDIGFEISALCVVIGCLAYMIPLQRCHGMRQRRFFILMLWCLAVSTAAEIAIHVLAAGLEERPPVLMETLGMIYLMSEELRAYLFSKYMYCLNGSTTVHTRLRVKLYNIPLIFGFAMILLSPWTGWIGRVGGNHFEAGPLFGLMYLIPLFYLASALINFIHYRTLVTNKAKNAIGTTYAICLFGYAIQFFYPEYLIQMFCNAVVLFFVMRFVEGDETMFDQASGLSNDRSLEYRIRQELAHHKPFRIVSFRVVNLSFTNSLFSASEQGTLIQAIAAWVRNDVMSENVLAFRFSDDRLLFMLNDTSEETYNAFVDKLWQRAQRPWLIGRRMINLHNTILSILMPEECAGYDELTEVLGEENYPSRQSIWVLGDAEKKEIQERLDIAGCIRRALHDDGIQVYYQPIWSADTDSIVAAEALLRVHDEKLGWVRPDKIVAVAEHNGTMGAIDRTVLAKVCAFLADQKPQQYGLQYIEVNLSLGEMLSPDLAETYKGILDSYHIPVDQINLEFTETFSDTESVVFDRAKRKLKDVGFKFSLDDFGTEFSNIYRLFTNEFENVKLDKSLLWNIDKDENTRRLVANFMRMLRMMDMNVLQEGVETEEQKEFVTANGCNLIQGWYFSKALPQDEFIAYVKDFNHKNEKVDRDAESA
jgi:EAL domain-containing protein (putative c-di-GMP-specific phosphodiesterase class I)/GGDEF domain-containing protein